jgi:UDP-N-acetyl-D-mannosaminuronate dehydrogenase
VADLSGGVDVDAVIVQAFHSEYAGLDWARFRGLKVVFDGRGAVDPDEVRRVGARYLAVGIREERSNSSH